MPLGVALKMLLENPSQRAFHPAYNARSTIACTPPAQPGSCNLKMNGNVAAGKAYTFGYLSTKIDVRMYCYISIVG
jgi:hypothetical protein